MDAVNASIKHTKHWELRNAKIPVKTENYAGKMHSKSMIVDDEYTIFGSMNFSNSGENRNDENFLVIKNEQIAKAGKDFFLYQWNKIDNKCYIGQSNNPTHRWTEHKYHVNNNDDIGKSAIHDAMRKYGIENFEFEVIELCSPENLIEVEIKYYNIYNPVYCMQSPKQDIRCYTEDWKQKCRKGCNFVLIYI